MVNHFILQYHKVCLIYVSYRLILKCEEFIRLLDWFNFVNLMNSNRIDNSRYPFCITLIFNDSFKVRKTTN